jgi:hypothetical protein
MHKSALTFGLLASSFPNALCDQGDTVLSGSYNLVSSNISSVCSIQDNSLTMQNGWQTFLTGSTAEADATVVATFIQCFDNPPLRP